jgi:ABC-type sugar transport system ATPase subunit
MSTRPRSSGITKRFPGVVANRDITFVGARGTVHALVGENGAGKSTLMKILYGVQRPTKGTIEVNGSAGGPFRSPSDAIKPQGIGMVFQHFMLADNFTVLENVILGAERLHGIGGHRRARERGSGGSRGTTAWILTRTHSSRISPWPTGNASKSPRCSSAVRESSSSTSPPPSSCRKRSTSSSSIFRR